MKESNSHGKLFRRFCSFPYWDTAKPTMSASAANPSSHPTQFWVRAPRECHYVTIVKNLHICWSLGWRGSRSREESMAARMRGPLILVYIYIYMPTGRPEIHLLRCISFELPIVFSEWEHQSSVPLDNGENTIRSLWKIWRSDRILQCEWIRYHGSWSS